GQDRIARWAGLAARDRRACAAERVAHRIDHRLAAVRRDPRPARRIVEQLVDLRQLAVLGGLGHPRWRITPGRAPRAAAPTGIDFSFEVNCAASSVARRMYTQDGDNQPDCDLAPVPLPDGGKIEGAGDYTCSGGDCHLIVYQGSRIYELYQASVTGGTFTGTC